MVNLELIIWVEFYEAPDSVDVDDSDDELAVEEEGIATDAAAMPDDGRDAHNSAIVKTTCDKAIEMMRLEDVFHCAVHIISSDFNLC